MRNHLPRWLFGPAVPRRRRGPRSRVAGCLLWVLVLLIVLVVLSLLFGGFRKGAKVGGAGPPAPVPAAALSAS